MLKILKHGEGVELPRCGVAMSGHGDGVSGRLQLGGNFFRNSFSALFLQPRLFSNYQQRVASKPTPLWSKP